RLRRHPSSTLFPYTTLFRSALDRNPETCVILIADGGTVELATEAMRQGAYDFQLRPLNFPKLLAVVERALSHQRLVSRASALERSEEHTSELQSRGHLVCRL